MDTGTTNPSLASLPSIVPTLQTQRSKLAYVGVIDDLLHFGRWSTTLGSVEDAAEFLMDKMTNDAPEKLEEMSSWLRQVRSSQQHV